MFYHLILNQEPTASLLTRKITELKISTSLHGIFCLSEIAPGRSPSVH